MNAHIYAKSVEIVCLSCERERTCEGEIPPAAVLPLVIFNKGLRAAGEEPFAHVCTDCGDEG